MSAEEDLDQRAREAGDELDPDDLEPAGEEVDGDPDVALTPPDEDDEEEQTSPAELAMRRPPAAAAADRDEDEIMSLVSDVDDPITDVIPTRVTPIKNGQEFVCARCHLVKPRVQLADAHRGLCRDCV
ncbi:MAG: DUF4193 family protein [Actinobacteria bacterium]|nr:DUF4193 family protein [Actinomycetota bacterium]